MKIVFRVNYRTVPGQSLWLRLGMNVASGSGFEQVLPMRWVNVEQWETDFDYRGDGELKMSYSYELRQEDGLRLEEWGDRRKALADSSAVDVLLIQDTWCSAGTVDYVYATRACRMLLPERQPGEVRQPVGENHTFQLFMAAVPPGCVVCISGGAWEAGVWDPARAIRMEEIAANSWQVHLRLADDRRFEYKYGLWDVAAGRMLELEAGPNRWLEPHSCGERQHTLVRDEGYRRDPSTHLRAAGVAVPVFSLRGKRGLGVGEFADLKDLADWASEAGLRMIQILPINDTVSAHDWTDSYPYSAISAFALHPLYMRVDDLDYPMPDGFALDVETARGKLNTCATVDYPAVMEAKWRFLREVFERHRVSIEAECGFSSFLTQNRQWVVPYAVFCVKRDQFGTANFSKWQEWAYYDQAKVFEMGSPEHADWREVSFHVWIQYELSKQLAEAVDHLHRRGIVLKGDLAIGVHRHSVEAWSAPQLFHLDAQAGAPPDAFSAKGQNWGFPTYHWEVMRRDGYAWWRSRFELLARYFDAYRIDHILGFFRIWQVPFEQVEGIMGWFDPAVPVRLEEFSNCGIDFNHERFCRPYLTEKFLRERFGGNFDQVRDRFVEETSAGFHQLRRHVSTQRRVMEHFGAVSGNDARMREGLLDCVGNVLFFEHPGSDGRQFHPRFGMLATGSFQELPEDQKWRLEELYVDYFYRRQESLWKTQGYGKLPVMRRASDMLLCGEDLGMVPACVPPAMREMGILSLEIERMPKSLDKRMADPAEAPYLSVVSTSTHDMSPLREWWREDPHATGEYAWHGLGEAALDELSPHLAARIVAKHLESPAMWAIFPIQDLLAIDAGLRHPDPAAERINIPVVSPHYWRYRLHVDLDVIRAAGEWTAKISDLVGKSGRLGKKCADFQTIP